MPAMPRRGVWSTSSTPFCLRVSRSASTSGVWKQMWWRPFAFAFEEAADGGVGASGLEELDLALADG